MTTKPSGVDLARQALLAAREAAKKNGATSKKPKRRTTTVVRRDGQEPLRLGSAISRMTTERGMVAPAAGGSVLAAFDTILAAVVPELAGRVQAVAFDAEPGRLDVVPDAPAVGTQLRWSAPKLIAAANKRVSGANVRALHVLAPAPMKAGPAVPVAPPGPAADRTRRAGAATRSAGGLPRGPRRPPRRLDETAAHQPEDPGSRRTAAPRAAAGTGKGLLCRSPGDGGTPHQSRHPATNALQ